MSYVCTISKMDAATWLARHHSREVGQIEVRGRTREEAVAKIEGEIRYRLELCPCTGETYRHIDVRVVDAP